MYNLFTVVQLIIIILNTPSDTLNISSDTKIFLPMVSVTPPKVGYAYSEMSEENTRLLHMQWYHNWNMSIAHSNIERVEHFSCEVRPYWTFDDDARNQFTDLRRIVARFGDAPFYLIFLNEPDLNEQCSRTPSHAAQMYKKVIEIAPNAIIIGPQVSDQDYLNDWAWLKEFYRYLDRMNLPYPQIGAIHSYLEEPPNNIVESYFNLPFSTSKIWIAEFGATNPETLRNFLLYYQSDPRIERYSYFAPIHTKDWSRYELVDEDGNLNDMGRVWVELH